MSESEERKTSSSGVGARPESAGPTGEELTMLTGSDGLKVILLGDSAVGKSKLVERFLLDNYRPHQLSTYALTLYKYKYKTPDGKAIPVDIWDTAGQERFNSMHASYYYRAHACIMVFDVTRKVTYKNLERWYDELQDHCPGIPTLIVANKIDIDYRVTDKKFGFADKHGLPFFFVSASDGTNVVQIFHTAILQGLKWKLSAKDDFYQEVLELLGDLDLQAKLQQKELIKAVLQSGDGFNEHKAEQQQY
eukprot:jgi/Chrzof1/12464/Cz06g35090.t1